jgi:flagellar basal-body rod protein FlgC
MSLFSVMDISGSALSAQSVRLNVTASNMANADSVSSSEGRTYRARHPVFSAVMSGAFAPDPASVGVRVDAIVNSDAPLRVEHQPDHPMADAEGRIFRSNVNLMEEMANMISASRSYQSNVEVMNVAKQMLLRTLALGQ